MEISGYSGYKIYEDGRVQNKHGRFLKQSVGTHGYLHVNLCKNGKHKKFNIHRLLCQAFLPNPENLRCVDHIDHNRQNNNLENLRWCSHSENSKNQSKQENTLFRGVGLYKNSWIASYYDNDGKLKAKWFSKNKYGNKGALRLAVEARYQAELDYDYTILQTADEFLNSETFINLV